MKRNKSIYIFIAILLLGSVLYFNFQIKEHFYNAYFMDLQTNTISKLGNKMYNIDYIEWSEDSKHFIFANQKVGYNIPPFKDEVVVFSVPELKNINMHEFNNNTLKYKRALVYMFENEIIVAIRYSNENYKYETYDFKSMKKTEITEAQFGQYVDTIKNGVARLNIKYNVPSYVEADIKKIYNENPEDILISNNGEKVLYSEADHKVYLLDLKTMERKFLFYGYNLNWSPRESKIAYCIPTKVKPEDYNFKRGYSNEDVTTYVYDLSNSKTVKVINFGAEVYFSYDDNYMVFYSAGYIGDLGAQ